MKITKDLISKIINPQKEILKRVQGILGGKFDVDLFIIEN
jgi:hypothetical protein